MTTKAINSMASAMVARIPSVMARSDDPRIASGKLLTRKQTHKLVVTQLTRLFKRLKIACDQMAVECEGKTAAGIREINKRKLDAIFGR
jgi:hypothetical protein